jgi:hypothetical protein
VAVKALESVVWIRVVPASNCQQATIHDRAVVLVVDVTVVENGSAVIMIGSAKHLRGITKTRWGGGGE